MFSCYFSWEFAVDRIVMEVKLKGLVQNPYYRYLDMALFVYLWVLIAAAIVINSISCQRPGMSCNDC